MSNYTPILRLEQPVTGALQGLWGERVNLGITALVEQALAGSSNVTMTDANYTLTVQNGAPDEARSMFVRLTGTLTQQRDVVVPTVTKIYIVENATTGGFGVNVRTSGGGGVVVPNGARRFLRVTATGVEVATTDLVNTIDNQTIGGNKTFSGTTTTFSAVGARIVGDFSNATIANRVMFQTSATNGNTSLGAIPNGSGQASAFGLFTSSSGGSAAITLRGGADTQDARIAAGTDSTGVTQYPMTFYTGGAERMRIDASGNVGIGGAPASGQRLHVFGTFNRIQADVCSLAFTSSGAVNNWFVGANVSDGVNGGFIIGQGTQITGGTPRLTIDASGDIQFQSTGSALRNVGSINSGQLAGMRNKIINGKMEIAQRGTSFPAIANGAYSLDRWLCGYVTSAVATITQQADAPSSNEFQNSLRVAVTTADTSIAAGDLFQVQQRIEGFNVRELIGRTFTLSFWVRSSKTGTHCVSFANGGGPPDRSWIAEYTINAANTWEYKTVTVNGGLITAGTWNWTNGIGLIVSFTLAAGSTLQATAGAWQAGNFFATANQVNCLDTIGNIFAITGVQLEVGSVATPFEHRPIGLEEFLCMRYGEPSPEMEMGAVGNATNVFGYWFPFKVQKRAAPTASATPTFTASNCTASAGTINAYGVRVQATVSTSAAFAFARSNAPFYSAEL